MFTGIVEEIGTIKQIKKGAVSASMVIEGSVVTTDSKVGDSIAVNGVCLTATKITGSIFEVDVMAETLRRSSLGELSIGSKVNLERAMAMGGRFGGHIVSGHIDGVGTIKDFKNEGNATWVRIAAPKEILKYIVMKGSIAIDGISLTVADLTETDFSVSVIPHTKDETTLLGKKIGATVNLENDIIGKYVERLMKPEGSNNKTNSSVSMSLLAENGFL